MKVSWWPWREFLIFNKLNPEYNPNTPICNKTGAPCPARAQHRSVSF